MKTRKFPLAWFAALLLMIQAVSTHATPVLVGEPNALTGIQGLEIDGVLYDVDFAHGTSNNSYDQFFGSSVPTFLGVGISSAINAATVLREFFNGFYFTASRVTGTFGMGSTGLPTIAIPYARPTINGLERIYSTGIVMPSSEYWLPLQQTINVRPNTTFTNISYARFTPQQLSLVPVPGTLMLLFAGFIGLCLWRRQPDAVPR